MTLSSVSLLLCALMALTAAAAQTDAEAFNENDTFLPVVNVSSELTKRMLLSSPAGGKRFYNPSSCPCGWTEYQDRCFLYVSDLMSWSGAERNCESMKANLASVRSFDEYLAIQRVTARYGYKNAWIGGSDAQQERWWFWIDGTAFKYTNWCTGQPDNKHGDQHCLQMNYGGKKCWDDVTCDVQLPSVCAKKILG